MQHGLFVKSFGEHKCWQPTIAVAASASRIFSFLSLILLLIVSKNAVHATIVSAVRDDYHTGIIFARCLTLVINNSQCDHFAIAYILQVVYE